MVNRYLFRAKPSQCLLVCRVVQIYALISLTLHLTFLWLTYTSL